MRLIDTDEFCGLIEKEFNDIAAENEIIINDFKNIIDLCPSATYVGSSLIRREDVDISLPSFATDEYVRDLMVKHHLTYTYDENEDEIYDFAMDLIQGFCNVVDSAEAIVPRKE